jgi:hypothetical protein
VESASCLGWEQNWPFAIGHMINSLEIFRSGIHYAE